MLVLNLIVLRLFIYLSIYLFIYLFIYFSLFKTDDLHGEYIPLAGYETRI